MVWLLWEIQSATMNWVQVLRWHHWKLVCPSLWFCSQEGFPGMIAMLAQSLQESLLSADAWPSLNQSLWFWLLQPVWAWGCVISPTWPRGHRGCGGEQFSPRMLCWVRKDGCPGCYITCRSPCPPHWPPLWSTLSYEHAEHGAESVGLVLYLERFPTHSYLLLLPHSPQTQRW